MKIFSGLNVHTLQGVQSVSVVVKEGLIHELTPVIGAADVLEFPADYHLVPGFIDLHVHGANGSDVMDATQEALLNISESLAKEGTTGFLATTMTAPVAEIDRVLVLVRDLMRQGQRNFLGVHLEGPFISAEKAGAQCAAHVLSPDSAHLQHWQQLAAGVIKLVTLAPELPNSLELIRYLTQHNIIASLGHSNATYAEADAAIAAGCSHATHLFNAMRGLHQREPGLVTAALLSEKVLVELIVDGVHLHPAVVELVLKMKGREKIALVTDSMRAKCLRDGTYDLGGQTVTVKGDKAELREGVLAGSVLKMNSALKNLLQFTGCSLADAIKMTSENPARALGIFAERGSITVGKAADLVVLDSELNVVLTMVGGEVVFRG